MAALFLGLGTVGAISANATPRYEGVSQNGSEVFFSTSEQMVLGDTDNKRDIYMRTFDPSVGEGGEYVTRQISLGPAGGNDAYDATFRGVSADGSKVFFETSEPLVAADTDRRQDVYMREPQTGKTSLVSVGEAPCEAGCGNPSPVSFAAMIADGSKVFFSTAERLVEADKDNATDVYERDVAADETFLVSLGEAGCLPACGNGEGSATLAGIASNGNRAFFTTTEQLSNLDTDEEIDIYGRDLPGGPTELISQGEAACQPGCGNAGERPAIFAGSSADGSRVFFETSEGLLSGDGDGSNDVYERTGGTTVLISGGSEATPATFRAASAAGDRVLFTTAEALAGGADTNTAPDVYRWQGGVRTLVTSGTCKQGGECGVTYKASAADATKVLFATTEQLVLEDEDSAPDIYEQEVGGSPTLVSAGEAACSPCGNGSDANFDAVSANGSRVTFSSEESLSLQDTDKTEDLYSRDVFSGKTELATPAGYCPVEKSKCGASFVGASPDGSHVFFQTVERVTTEDEGGEADIYESELGPERKTRMVSRGNSLEVELELGPEPPVLERTNPKSPDLSTEPAVVGHAEPGVTVQLYANEACTGSALEGTVSELESPGIKISVEAGSTTRFAAIAVDEHGNPSACSASIAYTAENPPPPPPPTEGSGGGSGGGTGGASGTSGSSGPGTGAGGQRSSGGLVYVTPEVQITFGPAFKTKKHKVVFQFADETGQPGTSFFCKLDKKAWGQCGSPKRLSHLRAGRHMFQVKAVNAVGTWGSGVVKRSFKVVGR